MAYTLMLLILFSGATTDDRRFQLNCGANSQRAATFVEDVYPSANRLPQNLLRFYVYFSSPMRRESVHGALSLVTSDGLIAPGVFLENRYELWSPDSRRLTVILDPGRVKTGLSSHHEHGSALIEGAAYKLKISREAVDARGCQLVEPFTKPFTVVSSDVVAPNIASWSLNVPTFGSRDPVTLHLDRSHDHVSMAHRIRAMSLDGRKIAGQIRLLDEESTWQFTPRDSWSGANYVLTIDPMFEDLAGNRLTGHFDDASGEARQHQRIHQSIEIPFRTKSPTQVASPGEHE